MNAKDLSARFVANVRRHLAALGWSQNEFALRHGIGSGAASRLLSGAHHPTFETVAKVADLFGVEPHELLEPVVGSGRVTRGL